jgi:hypothetical protein
MNNKKTLELKFEEKKVVFTKNRYGIYVYRNFEIKFDPEYGWICLVFALSDKEKLGLSAGYGFCPSYQKAFDLAIKEIKHDIEKLSKTIEL